ncbi:MAG TPA: hypothetical protein VMF51_24585 [Nocardioides sp.]|uniref:hypothetical protein n=1 Tax=Nocardioides sp. TaxID=35761 RepID=UPI002C9678FB|nr:hypothetical protein [Nocardioides sp.]HTW18324.1 hypothetical protein [Nocardioides sp.]
MTAPFAPGSHHHVARRTGRLLSVLLGTVLGALLLTGGASDPEVTGAVSPATVGECLGAGQVWLHVQTEDERVLRSECVGTPATGQAALAAAEVDSRESKGGYLCTLAGYPETCPSSFTGQYWQYWYADGLGADWSFSQKGAGARRPTPGGIEGWCYNADDEKRCDLPRLSADGEPAERIDLHQDSKGLGPWVVGVVVVVVAAGSLLLARRRIR